MRCQGMSWYRGDVTLVCFYMVNWKRGRVWFMATVLKTVDPQGSVSSNLTASTKLRSVGRMVMHRFTKPQVVEIRPQGSTP